MGLFTIEYYRVLLYTGYTRTSTSFWAPRGCVGDLRKEWVGGESAPRWDVLTCTSCAVLYGEAQDGHARHVGTVNPREGRGGEGRVM